MSIRSVRLLFVVATLLAISLVGSAQVRIVPSRIPSGSAALFGDGSASVPSIAFAANSSTGIWRPAVNGLAIAMSTASRYYFTQTTFQMPATQIFGWNASSDATATANDTTITRLAAGSIGFNDGTVTNPALAFQSETGLGLYRISAGTMRATGSLSVPALAIDGAGSFNFAARGYLTALADGAWTLRNNGLTTGVSLKFDALPTVASGFGTSPSITAGSTPLAGSVNVGTGGTATSGVIAFNGTAFPSAPFCVATDQNSNIATRVASSTTQLTLTVTVAWGASDIVNWICISSK